MIWIREEEPQDIQAIREVNRKAFGQSQEADLVDKLRYNCDDLISLVALAKDNIVGHLLYDVM